MGFVTDETLNHEGYSLSWNCTLSWSINNYISGMPVFSDLIGIFAIRVIKCSWCN